MSLQTETLCSFGFFVRSFPHSVKGLKACVFSSESDRSTMQRVRVKRTREWEKRIRLYFSELCFRFRLDSSIHLILCCIQFICSIDQNTQCAVFIFRRWIFFSFCSVSFSSSLFIYILIWLCSYWLLYLYALFEVYVHVQGCLSALSILYALLIHSTV